MTSTIQWRVALNNSWPRVLSRRTIFDDRRPAEFADRDALVVELIESNRRANVDLDNTSPRQSTMRTTHQFDALRESTAARTAREHKFAVVHSHTQFIENGIVQRPAFVDSPQQF